VHSRDVWLVLEGIVHPSSGINEQFVAIVVICVNWYDCWIMQQRGYELSSNNFGLLFNNVTDRKNKYKSIDWLITIKC